MDLCLVPDCSPLSYWHIHFSHFVCVPHGPFCSLYILLPNLHPGRDLSCCRCLPSNLMVQNPCLPFCIPTFYAFPNGTVSSLVITPCKTYILLPPGFPNPWIVSPYETRSTRVCFAPTQFTFFLYYFRNLSPLPIFASPLSELAPQIRHTVPLVRSAFLG